MRTIVLSAALGLLLAPAAATPADEILHPDLSGEWTLNAEASDDPAEVQRRARSGQTGGGGMSGGGGGGGGRGGGGGHGGGKHGGGSPGREGEGGNPTGRMMARYATLTIFQEGDELDITDGLDISRLLRTDGTPQKVWTERGQVQATAAWRSATLEVVWRGDDWERTSRLALSTDGSRLVLVEEIGAPTSERRTTLRLVYDRVGYAAREALR